VLFCLSICSTINEIKLLPFLKTALDKTNIYEDYFVNPNEVKISTNGKTKNIIHLYLESMETTYASDKEGGFQGENNYIPNLTQLAKENVSFSNSDKLGGFKYLYGAGTTSTALFSSTSGIPYSFPADSNGGMTQHEKFAAGTTTLGDILNEYHYNQEFLCGSDSTFGARKKFFEEHGNSTIFDYYTAIEKKYIPNDYKVWWGFEDTKLYGIAKDEISRLAESDDPFNFTFLTVDTHHIGGYVCDECENKYDIRLANVIDCADRQVYDFINWCKQQPFYDNTVIVISGDHQRMDDILVSGVNSENRTVYNCIINTDTKAQSETKNRTFTSIDMFPTTLAAMGFEIEGDQLGLGVNLFSKKETLSEQLGYDYFSNELTKYSKYYIDHFS
jgi:Phosphoglycerol transferase and related proteins, alkaline phosphatase superfamily